MKGVAFRKIEAITCPEGPKGPNFLELQAPLVPVYPYRWHSTRLASL